MGKAVYSLVLSTDVVQAVDALAASQGYSRSALVNHILAEHASVTSPQRQARELLETVRNEAQNRGLRSQNATAASLTLKTALCYKYNPALSYVVELTNTHGVIGDLRVSLRSQNQTLLQYFSSFLQLWCRLEAIHLAAPPALDAQQIEPRRYVRTLRSPGATVGGEATGKIVAEYISMLNTCLETFMAHRNNATDAIRNTEKAYLTGLQASNGLKLL